MRVLYAVALIAGTVGLFLVVPASRAVRLGRRARIATAAVAGFGLAGMSASYAGWAALPAAASALASAVVLGVYAGSSWARDEGGA